MFNRPSEKLKVTAIVITELKRLNEILLVFGNVYNLT